MSKAVKRVVKGKSKTAAKRGGTPTGRQTEPSHKSVQAKGADPQRGQKIR